MKIKLPNPDDYGNDVMGFLEQMELCVHHAKKSAEKILAKYSEEDIKEGNDTPYVVFRHPQIDYEKYYEIIDNQLDQDIEIEVAEV